MMFVPKRNNGDEVKYNKWLASLLAFIVGGASGIIGAGGSFISSDYVSYFKVTDTYNDSNIYRYYVYFLSRDYNWKSDNWTSSCNSSSYYCDCKYLCSAAGSASREEDQSKALQYMLSILIVGTAVKMWIDMLSK